MSVGAVLAVLFVIASVPVPAAAAPPTCDGLPATIARTGADDVIVGTSGGDVIYAGGGNDVVNGGGGADRICGGGGKDELSGDGGNDRLFGGDGKDRLYGNAGRDFFDGGTGTDRCSDDVGEDVVACEKPFTRVYVSALSGNDANPGNASAPLSTIGAAQALVAASAFPVEVIIGEGTYPEKVTLAEGVSLLGGYACTVLPCSWTRDPGNHVSTIVDQDFEGVLAGLSITRQTRLDGFTIEGLDGTPTSFGTALTINGGSPSVTGNRVLGGDVTGTRTSYGVFGASSASPGPLIQRNAALAGDSPTGQSWAVALFATAAEVDSNRINIDQANVGTCGSTTQWCGGILALSMSISGTITNNVVFGLKGPRSAAVRVGEGETPPPAALAVNANYLDGGGMTPLTAGSKSAAISLAKAACESCGFNTIVGRLRNNALYGGINETRYGVVEDAIPTRNIHFEVLDHNDLYFMPASGHIDVLWRRWDGMTATDYTSLTVIENNFTSATANISADCLFDPTFHLGGGSPCIDAGTSTEAPAADFEGDTRPQGNAVDIGPDEAG